MTKKRPPRRAGRQGFRDVRGASGDDDGVEWERLRAIRDTRLPFHVDPASIRTLETSAGARGQPAGIDGIHCFTNFGQDGRLIAGARPDLEDFSDPTNSRSCVNQRDGCRVGRWSALLDWKARSLYKGPGETSAGRQTGWRGTVAWPRRTGRRPRGCPSHANCPLDHLCRQRARQTPASRCQRRSRTRAMIQHVGATRRKHTHFGRTCCWKVGVSEASAAPVKLSSATGICRS